MSACPAYRPGWVFFPHAGIARISERHSPRNPVTQSSPTKGADVREATPAKETADLNDSRPPAERARAERRRRRRTPRHNSTSRHVTFVLEAIDDESGGTVFRYSTSEFRFERPEPVLQILVSQAACHPPPQAFPACRIDANRCQQPFCLRQARSACGNQKGPAHSGDDLLAPATKKRSRQLSM